MVNCYDKLGPMLYLLTIARGFKGLKQAIKVEYSLEWYSKVTHFQAHR